MSRRSFEASELQLLLSIDKLLRRVAIRGDIDRCANEIQCELEQEKEKPLIWRSLPLALFSHRLPKEIKSCWVFGIQANTETGAERHPRSHQRMMSYLGSGDLQVWDGKRWVSRKLVSDEAEKIGKRWISITPNAWHQAVAGDNIWIVVSFHTVADDELIEERPDPDDPMLMHKRTYLS